MTPYYTDESVTLHHGDCLDVLTADVLGYDHRLGYAPPAFSDDSVDAICTDPPYGIRFMGKAWDGEDIVRGIGIRRSQAVMPEDGKVGRNGGYQSPAAEAGRYDQSTSANHAFQAWCTDWATECLRILKPGGHLLSFGGSRTWHRLTCAVEDAGFEIRDSIAWLYGSGFPKSMDVSKAIDKAAGAEREVIGQTSAGTSSLQRVSRVEQGYRDNLTAVTPEAIPLTAPATEAAQQWQGWGTALKPAFEPIVVGRKPFPGTVAGNVQEHGTGALNIDGCRVAGEVPSTTQGQSSSAGTIYGADQRTLREFVPNTAGRWPTNVVLDESQAAELDQQTGTLTSGSRAAGTYGLMGYMGADAAPMPAVNGDSGGASRFFPVFPSAFLADMGDLSRYSADDLGESYGRWLEEADQEPKHLPTFRYEAKAPSSERPRDGETAHPTVKPLDLIRWLVRLVTPPGGTVLEPFAGSGTTAEACVIEGFNCIAIEREADYLPLIINRLTKPIQMGLDFEGGAA